MRSAGFTLLEALVALALALLVVSAALTLLLPGQAVVQAQPVTLDLQQRLRGSIEALVRELEMAGAGLPAGPDAGSWAGRSVLVLPRVAGRLGDAARTARSDAITIGYVPYGWAFGRTTTAIPPIDSVGVQGAPVCPAASPACGFTAGMSVAVYDDSGRYDIFTVRRVEGNAVSLDPHAPALSAVYAAGVRIAQVEASSFYLDSAADRLRRYDGVSSDAPVADNVVGLTFEYLATGAAGVEPLPLSALADGPWQGIGTWEFDADLLRLRAIRVTLRMQAALPEFRVGAPAFVRPGTSRSSARYVPDLEASVQVWPRNLEPFR